MKSIKRLPITFEGIGEVRGFVFQFMARSHHALIYLIDTGGSKHFEVFKIKTSQKCLNFDLKVYSETDLKERYPRSNDFGIWAWSLWTKKRAFEKFNLLNNE